MLGVSQDDAETHARWRDTAIEEGGIGPIRYPLLADTDKAITAAYGCAHADTGLSYRATFLIDKDGVVQHAVHNNLPLGRDVDEFLRVVDALQFHEQHGEVCPAGWAPGKPGMKASPEGVKEYLAKNASSL